MFHSYRSKGSLSRETSPLMNSDSGFSDSGSDNNNNSSSNNNHNHKPFQHLPDKAEIALRKREVVLTLMALSKVSGFHCENSLAFHCAGLALPTAEEMGGSLYR